ncbi:MAG: amidohydrolase [Blautia sp.]|nr:amidohydrolase [Blautia sp.]
MYKIIDSHCHIYPESIARKAVKAVDRFYDGLPADHHDGTVATLMKSSKACGISHCIVHSVATSPHQVSTINQFIADSVAEADGFFTGLGTLHLESDDYERDLDELVCLGLKGVKLHPDIQHFYVDELNAMRIFEMCEERGLPICVHTGDYRYDYSNPVRVARVLRAFPKLKFIGAHFGGWSVWEEAKRLLADFPNLIVDSSSSFPWLTSGQAKDLIYAYGPERVMFGTDYPLWHQEPDIGFLLKLELPEEDYERIFHRNMEELFGLACGCMPGKGKQ